MAWKSVIKWLSSIEEDKIKKQWPTFYVLFLNAYTCVYGHKICRKQQQVLFNKYSLLNHWKIERRGTITDGRCPSTLECPRTFFFFILVYSLDIFVTLDPLSSCQSSRFVIILCTFLFLFLFSFDNDSIKFFFFFTETGDISCNLAKSIVRLHNKLRQAVAQGMIYNQPAASNMREMVIGKTIFIKKKEILY